MCCGDDLRLVRTVDEMLELLVSSGEAQVKLIGSSHVVPHKMNRGGGMLEVRKVYAKGCKIMGVGFSMARCDPKRAVAFQSKPGDDSNHRRFVDFANRTPHLASFDSSQVEACSVGCGHLNQFLALVRAEVVAPPTSSTTTRTSSGRRAVRISIVICCASRRAPSLTRLWIRA